jgi:hypothetical protein
MMFREVVSKVGGPWFPENMKMSLFAAITHPVETHIHGA